MTKCVLCQIVTAAVLLIQRQKPEAADLSDDEDAEQECADDEKPVVVVLRAGDLTAEEAEEHAALEGQQEPGVCRWCVSCNVNGVQMMIGGEII